MAIANQIKSVNRRPENIATIIGPVNSIATAIPKGIREIAL